MYEEWFRKFRHNLVKAFLQGEAQENDRNVRACVRFSLGQKLGIHPNLINPEDHDVEFIRECVSTIYPKDDAHAIVAFYQMGRSAHIHNGSDRKSSLRKENSKSRDLE